MAKKNYSSIYSIKDFALNELIPKYFPTDVNNLNIGLLGYTTELISNTTEDIFNAVSTFMKELYPNKARMPESIYNYAALFQEENLFATPASLYVMVFLNEKDIIKLGAKLPNNNIDFYLDQNMIIDVEGKQFMPDYDIKITAKPYQNDYIFSALYDIQFINSISDINEPYIKLKRIHYNNNNYLGLLLKVRQCVKYTKHEQIISNDKINLPTIPIQFNNQIANFEIFYKSPSSDSYVQLKKRLANSTPIKQSFCYYNFINVNEIEISFTSRSNYFQPEFNSEFLIEYYETTGTSGNFTKYTGLNVSVSIKSEKYDYNNSLVIFAIPQSASIEGYDTMTLEELRSSVNEKFSTVGSYTNENDLQLYFQRYKNKFGNEMLFVKKRDDIYQRLFSAFALLKDSDDNVYPTNTVHLNLLPSDFDSFHDQTNLYILKPGNLFKYEPNSIDTIKKISGKTITDDLNVINETFIYTNPYLITVLKNPSIVGFYLNSIDDNVTLDYSYVNTDSFVQFICNSLSIQRNALYGENDYNIIISITPTTDLEIPLVDEETGDDLGVVKIKLMVEDKNAPEFCYVDFSLMSHDKENNIYTYGAKLTTDDYMTLNNKLKILNTIDLETNQPEIKLIPMYDCKINICVFYQSPTPNTNQYSYLPDVQNYTLTNIYSTMDQGINFITPLTLVRSQMKYIQIDESEYKMNLSFVPVISAKTMKDTEKYKTFINSLYNQFDYMENIMDKLLNNFSLDIKFYNTYGKSKNFTAGENGNLLNKVNCNIAFAVAATAGTNLNTLITDLKIFIKNTIETINENTSNSIYVSNLIRKIEENFSGIKYLKFIRINNYDSSIQIIENQTVDFNSLNISQRKNFVPEYLTMGIDDIRIEII